MSCTKEKVVKDPESISSVYSYNNGIFPYVLRPYKYMLLRSGRTSKADVMLLELKDSSEWGLIPESNIDENGDLIDRDTEKVIAHTTDTITNKTLEISDFKDTNICQWIVIYKVKKVLKFKGEAIDWDDLEEESSDER